VRAALSRFLVRQKGRYVLLFAILITASVPRVNASSTRPDDYIARAMQLYRNLYPQLRNVCAAIGDEVDLHSRPPRYPDAIYTFTMTLHHCQLGPPTFSNHSEPFISSRFDFMPDTNQLKVLSVWGSLVRARLEKLEAELENHPEWSFAQKVRTLKRSGAKFGPDDRAEFLRALPLKELEVVTGRVEIVSADFALRYAPSKLIWEVRAKWHSEDGQYEADYLLSFEPFEGQLIEARLRSELRRVK